MSPKSVLITGANRGVGLELVKQWFRSKKPPEHIFATFRDYERSKELLNLASADDRIHPLQFDVTDYSKHDDFVEKVREILGPESGLNLLIHNAGHMSPSQGLDDLTVEDLATSFDVNATAPLFLSRTLIPLLTKEASKDPSKLDIDQAAIVFVSTSAASIKCNSGGHPLGPLIAYRASKAAINMVMKSLSVDLSGQGILVMSLHPGWIQTRMGGPNARSTVESAVKDMLDVMMNLTEKDHGCFKRFDFAFMAW